MDGTVVSIHFQDVTHKNCLTLSQVDPSNPKAFADDNLKFGGNGKVLQKGRKHCGKRRNCSL